MFTFQQIPPGVASANQLSLILTGGVAEILIPDVLPDSTLHFIRAWDIHRETCGLIVRL